MATIFVWGIVHFLSAIPVGVGMKLSPAVAAFCAGAGYVAIGGAMLVVGQPVRQWMVKKFNFSTEPNPKKLFWRVWLRWGMPGLGLLAPLTIGPYFAALLALALGEKPGRLMFWITLGVIPWCIVIAALAAAGVNVFDAFKK